MRSMITMDFQDIDPEEALVDFQTVDPADISLDIGENPFLVDAGHGGNDKVQVSVRYVSH
jgi:centromeric protein E